MAYLTRRYGTESAVFQSMLDDLLALHSPKNEKEEEVNLAKISALTSISTDADDKELYTMDKVKSLVNSTLLDETRHLFWNKFLECKHENFMLLSDCPEQDWDARYEKNNSEHCVSFLNAFINRRLDVLPYLSVDVGKQTIRPPKLQMQMNVFPEFGSVCIKFIEMKVRERIAVCNQQNYCKICTCDLTSKIHKTTTGVCPYLEMFACSVCPQEKAKNHCNMLCLSQENSTKLGRGSFGRRPPDDRPLPRWWWR